jgi:hypothetical protein
MKRLDLCFSLYYQEVLLKQIEEYQRDKLRESAARRAWRLRALTCGIRLLKRETFQPSLLVGQANIHLYPFPTVP